MSATEITFSEAQRLTEDYLTSWMNQLPYAQRSAPVIVFDNRTWSIPEMRGQVQMGTSVGTRYVNFYVKSLKRYVIAG